MSFINYMEDSIDYPNPTECMLDHNVCLDYISHTFLDGWINYVEIISANIITRYYDYKLNLDNYNRYKFPFHSNFANFKDDVIILAKDKKENY